MEHLGTYGSTPPTKMQAMTLVDGVVRAVGALHSAGVAHRDVKPQQFVLVGLGLKIVDFDQARGSRRTY